MFLSGFLLCTIPVAAAGGEWIGVDVGHKGALLGVHFCDANHGVCWSDALLWRTADGGVSWKKLGTPSLESVGKTGDIHWVSVKLAGPTEITGLMALNQESGSKHMLLRSQDGGSTWTDSTPGELGVPTRLIVRKTRWWILADGGKSAFVSRNGGQEWEKVGWGSADRSVRDLAFPSAQLGFAVGGTSTGARVWKTEDGGKNWRDAAAIKETGNLLHCAFPSEKQGWMAGENGQLWRTLDGSATWEKCDAPFQSNQQITGLTFFPSGKGFVSASVPFIQGRLGAEVGVAYTPDGGETWETHVKGWKSIEDIFFLDANNGWACGENPGWISYGIMLLFVGAE